MGSTSLEGKFGAVIAIIDYGMSNMHSVLKAVEEITFEPVSIVNHPKDLAKADKVILPGVGSFSTGIKNLQTTGLAQELNRQIIELKKPFLGICLGMQLIAEAGEEYGFHKGLNWIKGRVIELKQNKKNKVPHIGWNSVKLLKKSPLFNNSLKEKDFYFVHKYHFQCEETDTILGVTPHYSNFVSSISKNNIFATQFHPEKSQASGLTILKNFINLK